MYIYLLTVLLRKNINQSLIINMKTLQHYITEKILINKNSKISYNYHPKTKDELKKIIKRRIESEGNECNLNDIDTSNITDMSDLFKDSEFNGDISKWDVSNVTDMGGMFRFSEFNGDISNWDISNVTTTEGMFVSSTFTGDISKWNVSNVTNMGGMFYGSKFNSDISKWDVSNVTNNTDIFYSCPIEEKYKPKFKI